jgi:outer membrane protein TolC
MHLAVWQRGPARACAIIGVTVLLAGCAIHPHPFTSAELSAQAQSDQSAMFDAVEPITTPLTLPDAIARALKYNLDKRAKMMEEALAIGQTDLDRFDMLPQLTVGAGYVGRSDHATTRSTDSVTLQPALADPYYSLDRDRRVANLGLSWNVLDFGISYYTAKQDADKALIADEHRRKSIHNLVQAVRYAYWRTVAYQELQPAVSHALDDAQSALDKAQALQTENVKAPEETLRYERALYETIRQILAVQDELSTAPIELASLINQPTSKAFTVAVPGDGDMVVPQWTLPLDKMEAVAFQNNPDLREQGYLGRIAVDDTHKAILKLLPGINLSASKQYDSNSFLVDKSWYESGAQLSWSLLNLVSAPARLRYAHTNEEVVAAQRMALRIAVLAQVHIAERQFRNASLAYHQALGLAQVDAQLSTLSANKTANDTQGELAQIADQGAAITSRLQRFQSYAQLQVAFATIQATVGKDLLPAALPSNDIATLSAIVARRLNALDHGEELGDADSQS